MQKIQRFLAAAAIFSLFFGPAILAHADDTTTTPAPADQTVITTDTQPTPTPVDPNQDLIDAITALKVKFSDPATSAWNKFWLPFQIRKLENELKLRQALQ
jgi:hypothetical protein